MKGRRQEKEADEDPKQRMRGTSMKRRREDDDCDDDDGDAHGTFFNVKKGTNTGKNMSKEAGEEEVTRQGISCGLVLCLDFTSLLPSLLHPQERSWSSVALL